MDPGLVSPCCRSRGWPRRSVPRPQPNSASTADSMTTFCVHSLPRGPSPRGTLRGRHSPIHAAKVAV
ncbi:hypothetical protein PsYK624_151400 [Phanerochaete sordida]|uniref:Uncharacterized protein n=1 Tax=Phanerochaete sordida TaxID=48140 RepID=A0A9P3LLP0_9APHY|nr:hypothetical protein PsYK624_151400 [Phanerochaete sordida]